MNARSWLLAPAPRAVTPDRVALAAVAALALAVTPTFLATHQEVREALGGSGAATAFTVFTTAALSVLLARRALRATSPRRARLTLVLGGCVAGALNALLFYAGILVFPAHPPGFLSLIETAVLMSVLFGTPLGALFGIMFSPVIVTATRARLSPSLDAVDRVLFATGASLLLAGAAWLVGSASLSSPATLAAAGVVGALAAGTAGARLVARVRFLERVRAGVEPGFRLTPRAGREEEAALLPWVRAQQLGGVVIATGADVPYRGERGASQLALAPLSDEPFHRPLAGLVGGALTEVASTLATLVVGLGSAAILVLLIMLWVFRDGLG